MPQNSVHNYGQPQGKPNLRLRWSSKNQSNKPSKTTLLSFKWEWAVKVQNDPTSPGLYSIQQSSTSIQTCLFQISYSRLENQSSWANLVPKKLKVVQKSTNSCLPLFKKHMKRDIILKKCSALLMYSLFLSVIFKRPF